MIPVGARNPDAAHAWINFVYQPKINALETSYTYYGSPVKRGLLRGALAAASSGTPTCSRRRASSRSSSRTASRRRGRGCESASGRSSRAPRGVDRSCGCEEGPPSLGRRRPSLSRLARLPAVLWYGVFFLVPLGIMAVYSFQLTVGYGDIAYAWTTENFTYLWDPLYGRIFWRTFQLAAITTLGTLLVGFPLAYYIARYAKRKTLLLLLVIVPFWTSFLITPYSWLVILDPDFFLWRALGLGDFEILYDEGDLHRRRLQLPHGAAAVRGARADGLVARGGGARTSGTAPFGPSAA